MDQVATNLLEHFLDSSYRCEGAAAPQPTPGHWLHTHQLVHDPDPKIPQPPEERTDTPRHAQHSQVKTEPLDSTAEDPAGLKYAHHLMQGARLMHVIERDPANHVGKLTISKRHLLARCADELDVTVYGATQPVTECEYIEITIQTHPQRWTPAQEAERLTSATADVEHPAFRAETRAPREETLKRITRQLPLFLDQLILNLLAQRCQRTVASH
jgi:hypothetical protein